MSLKRIGKFILIVPWYLFLLLEGFIGGGTGKKDNWDDLCKWARK